jgi:ABC-type Na+ transport system ATPase subunit NatA
MLEVIALRKCYGAQVDVDGVSLCAGKGQTIGLLIMNGGGKTTMVSMAVAWCGRIRAKPASPDKHSAARTVLLS